MKRTFPNRNVSNHERAIRIGLSGALIGAVLVAPETTPAWFAIVALYPAFTALMAWDPVYHLIPNFEPRAMAEMKPIRVAHSPARVGSRARYGDYK